MPAGFEPREIVCASAEAAEAEAQRQQERDDAAEAEWIYLRNPGGDWVARRTPRAYEVEPREPMSAKRAFLDWLLNPFEWLWR